MKTPDTQIILRQATTADIPAIRVMADVAFRHTYREILSPEQMEYMMEWMYSEQSLTRQLTVEGHTYIILSQEGRGDVGYVSLNLEHEDAQGLLFHLQKIYVLPERQGQGLGAALLHAAEAQMRQMAGSSPVRYELNVNRNNPALHFYEHEGLHKVREGDFPIGNGFYMNDFIMGKEV